MDFKLPRNTKYVYPLPFCMYFGSYSWNNDKWGTEKGHYILFCIWYKAKFGFFWLSGLDHTYMTIYQISPSFNWNSSNVDGPNYHAQDLSRRETRRHNK